MRSLVMLQAMKDELPINTKCKDKFLIQSTIITPDKESMSLQDMVRPARVAAAASVGLRKHRVQWNVEGDEVHSQKIRVVYLPPEGQTVPEEDETHVNMSSLLAVPGQDVSRSLSHSEPPASRPSSYFHRTTPPSASTRLPMVMQRGNRAKAMRARSRFRHRSMRSTTMRHRPHQMLPFIRPSLRPHSSNRRQATRVSVLSTSACMRPRPDALRLRLRHPRPAHRRPRKSSFRIRTLSSSRSSRMHRAKLSASDNLSHPCPSRV